MNARERLQKLQTALEERGVRDVKFFFSNAALGTPTQCAHSAAVVLDAYLAGKCVDAERYAKSI